MKLERDEVKPVQLMAPIPTDPNDTSMTIHGGWYIGAGIVLCGIMYMAMDGGGWFG